MLEFTRRGSSMFAVRRSAFVRFEVLCSRAFATLNTERYEPRTREHPNVEPRTSNPERQLFHGHDLHMPFTPDDGDTKIVRMPFELQIDLGLADREIAQTNPIDRLGQLSA